VVKDIAMGLSRRDLLVGIGGVSGGMILAGRTLAELSQFTAPPINSKSSL
jgi:hypothetical protein